MKSRIHTFFITLLFGTLAFFLMPGVALPQGSDLTPIIRDVAVNGFPIFTVNTSVVDRNGLPVSGLTPENFSFLEDSRAIRVENVNVTQDAPISVCLAIDVSGSMVGPKMVSARNAAASFIDQMGPDDTACVIAFSDRIDVNSPLTLNPPKELGFTGDRAALKQFIASLEADPQPGTPLYDSALKAIKLVASQPLGTRAVILFTDGKDERLSDDGTQVLPGSISAREDPSREAQAAHIPVFTIGLGDVDADYLSSLAVQTGGRYQRADNPEQLTQLFGNIAAQLKSQYAVTYKTRLYPDDQDHILQMTVKTNNGQAETRTTFTLPKTIQAAPDVTLFYRDGETTRELSTGQKLKGNVPIVPEIRTNEAISYAVFLIDDSPVFTQTLAPWNFVWNTGDEARYPLGLHIVKVRAYDERGQMGEASAGVETLRITLLETIDALPLAAKLGIAAIALVLIFGLAVLALRGRGTPPPTQQPPPDLRDTVSAPLPIQVPTIQEPRPFVSPRPSPTQTMGTDFGSSSEQPPAQQKTVILRQKPVSVAFLVMEQGEHVGREFVLQESETGIGRAADNDIVLSDPMVGRHQSKIKREGADLFLYDMGATNTTRINSAELRGRHKLVENDRIQVGNVVFVFKQASTKP